MAKLEGKEAPAFKLEGSDGKTHALSDYKGKYVVLYFYPKDNTPGCTKEACAFRDLSPKLAKLNAVVLGVSKDGLASHDKFISEFKLPFVLLSDPDLEVLKAYEAWGEKERYGKTSMGTIRSTVVIGPEGKVMKHWETVKKAEDHPEQVLAYLKSMA